jgi:hypothetical protein
MAEKKSTVKFATEVAKPFAEENTASQQKEITISQSILKKDKEQEPSVTAPADIVYVTDDDDTTEPFYS